ncbi:MAG: hypothetical protein ACMXYC_02190 [Candidatus Woesearchaeota archaeon]
MWVFIGLALLISFALYVLHTKGTILLLYSPAKRYVGVWLLCSTCMLPFLVVSVSAVVVQQTQIVYMMSISAAILGLLLLSAIPVLLYNHKQEVWNHVRVDIPLLLGITGLYVVVHVFSSITFVHAIILLLGFFVYMYHFVHNMQQPVVPQHIPNALPAFFMFLLGILLLIASSIGVFYIVSLYTIKQYTTYMVLILPILLLFYIGYIVLKNWSAKRLQVAWGYLMCWYVSALCIPPILLTFHHPVQGVGFDVLAFLIVAVLYYGFMLMDRCISKAEAWLFLLVAITWILFMI